jgi:hypothetical protein
MPNWCQNTAVINAPKPVIDEIKQIVDQKKGLLDWMRHRPGSEDENWYDWNCRNWGTKWDTHEPFVSDDTEEDSITLSFDTAWAPPLEAFRYWAKQDGRVTYKLSYVETGIAFVGWDSYDGEYFDEDYVEHGQDPDRYWEMAGEEFGMEPEEDPEPLTEWYEQGVKDKGLNT